MREEKFGLTDETLQRYYDGELTEREHKAAEAGLAESPESREQLRLFTQVSGALGHLGGSCEPDELLTRRNWEAIALKLDRRKASPRRRAAWWLSAAAAAAVVLVLLSAPFQKAQSNALEIESIDCSYAGFMLISPPTDNGVTIIWIDDQGN